MEKCNEKQIKSTLEYLEIQQNPIGTPHNILRSVKNRKYDIQKAEIKLRLITTTMLSSAVIKYLRSVNYVGKKKIESIFY